jgi:hypothetical protein
LNSSYTEYFQKNREPGKPGEKTITLSKKPCQE